MFFHHLNYSKYLCILALFFVLSFFLDRLNSHFNCFYFKKWKQLYLLYILRFDFIFEALKFQVMWEAFLRWSIFLEGMFLDFEWWFCVMFSLLLWVLFHLSKKLLLKDSNETCSFIFVSAGDLFIVLGSSLSSCWKMSFMSWSILLAGWTVFWKKLSLNRL